MLEATTCRKVLGELFPRTRSCIVRTVLCFVPLVHTHTHERPKSITDCVSYFRFHCRGRLVKDRETKQPRLDARNWECGVVMPMAPNQASRGTSGGEAEIVEVFCGFPIPIELPGLPYGDDERSPWFMDEA